ncbi:hypothetical protein ACFL1H_02000 [Nanoarchaeota archaeon]
MENFIKKYKNYMTDLTMKKSRKITELKDLQKTYVENMGEEDPRINDKIELVQNRHTYITEKLDVQRNKYEDLMETSDTTLVTINSNVRNDIANNEFYVNAQNEYKPQILNRSLNRDNYKLILFEPGEETSNEIVVATPEMTEVQIKEYINNKPYIGMSSFKIVKDLVKIGFTDDHLDMLIDTISINDSIKEGLANKFNNFMGSVVQFYDQAILSNSTISYDTFTSFLDEISDIDEMKSIIEHAYDTSVMLYLEFGAEKTITLDEVIKHKRDGDDDYSHIAIIMDLYNEHKSTGVSPELLLDIRRMNFSLTYETENYEEKLLDL